MCLKDIGERAMLNKSVCASLCVEENVNPVVQLVIPDLHVSAILKSVLNIHSMFC